MRTTIWLLGVIYVFGHRHIDPEPLEGDSFSTGVLIIGLALCVVQDIKDIVA